MKQEEALTVELIRSNIMSLFGRAINKLLWKWHRGWTEQWGDRGVWNQQHRLEQRARQKTVVCWHLWAPVLLRVWHIDDHTASWGPSEHQQTTERTRVIQCYARDWEICSYFSMPKKCSSLVTIWAVFGMKYGWKCIWVLCGESIDYFLITFQLRITWIYGGDVRRS